MQQANQRTMFFVSTGIIIIISSLISPLFLGEMLRDILFRPERPIVFSSSPSTYIIFIISVIFLGIGILMIPFLAKKKWIPGIIILLSAVFIFLSVDEYHYATAEGFYNNSFYEVKGEMVKWKDINSMKQIYVKEDGTQVPKLLRFDLRNGSSVTMEFDKRLFDSRREIDSLVQGAGGKSTIKVVDKIDDSLKK
ncbi:hypothetical protein [Falsibacillus albus]|uniref:DUF5673 domain-containing protein n=1 Tax=Falsibacillus albus TaxID=2478915 RepID=A0A3L7JMB0_9BACI|nr:hypothetical protein [Falsibacillus albus]RLQ91610.1 hypothetical protein D9X91_20615 [Falsibacillus albus]